MNQMNPVTDLQRLIIEMPTEKMPEVIGMLWMLLTRAEMCSRANSTPPRPIEPDRFLTVEEVVERYRVKKEWLYRHKKKMPHSQPSRKKLLFPEKAIERWFTTRKGG